MRRWWKSGPLLPLLFAGAAVAVLAAILFPVFAQSRERARRGSAAQANGRETVSAAGAMAPAAGRALAGGARDYDAAAKDAPTENAGGGAAKVPSPPARRIIYTSEVELVAEDLTKTEAALQRLVKANGGFVAGMEVSGTPRAPRSGRWTVRIPVDRFDAFMNAVTGLGELQRIHTDSQDVTEEYVDLEARLANKRVEERRLLQHLTRNTAKLEEILAVEKELSRVREESEQMEGRRRLLANQTELTTVTISLSEVQEYRPPREPGFGNQLLRAFVDSASSLRDVLKGLALFTVASVPWLVSLAVLGCIGLWGYRRLRSRHEETGI